jgi:hypothetical protein
MGRYDEEYIYVTKKYTFVKFVAIRFSGTLYETIWRYYQERYNS